MPPLFMRLFMLAAIALAASSAMKAHAAAAHIDAPQAVLAAPGIA